MSMRGQSGIIVWSVLMERISIERSPRVSELREFIRRKYADELASAGPIARWKVRRRMRRELREEMRKLLPSKSAV